MDMFAAMFVEQYGDDDCLSLVSDTEDIASEDHVTTVQSDSPIGEMSEVLTHQDDDQHTSPLDTYPEQHTSNENKENQLSNLGSSLTSSGKNPTNTEESVEAITSTICDQVLKDVSNQAQYEEYYVSNAGPLIQGMFVEESLPFLQSQTNETPAVTQPDASPPQTSTAAPNTLTEASTARGTTSAQRRCTITPAGHYEVNLNRQTTSNASVHCSTTVSSAIQHIAGPSSAQQSYPDLTMRTVSSLGDTTWPESHMLSYGTSYTQIIDLSGDDQREDVSRISHNDTLHASPDTTIFDPLLSSTRRMENMPVHVPENVRPRVIQSPPPPDGKIRKEKPGNCFVDGCEDWGRWFLDIRRHHKDRHEGRYKVMCPCCGEVRSNKSNANRHLPSCLRSTLSIIQTLCPSKDQPKLAKYLSTLIPLIWSLLHQPVCSADASLHHASIELLGELFYRAPQEIHYYLGDAFRNLISFLVRLTVADGLVTDTEMDQLFTAVDTYFVILRDGSDEAQWDLLLSEQIELNKEDDHIVALIQQYARSEDSSNSTDSTNSPN